MMGLMIHSLGEMPTETCRGYYVYLLDYGWQEPTVTRLHDNFDRLSDLASHNDAVVLRGTVGSHFVDEVLSWHHINGQDAEGLLPAILVTTRHPEEFRSAEEKTRLEHPMLLIPLRQICRSPDDAIPLVEKLFSDIRDRKNLADFTVAKHLRKGQNGALVDALILQPTIGGMGVDLKVIVSLLGHAAKKVMGSRTKPCS
jgi:hypothetical protein